MSIYYALFLRNLECLLSPLNVEWICHQTSPLANQCLFLKWKLCSGNFCVGDVEATEKKRRSNCILAREVVAIAGILGSSLWSLSYIGVVGAATGSAPTNLYNSRSKVATGIAISYLA